MIIATAGHVDHGKTTLVKALTGVDTDRLAEEKQRGLTIDLGFAYWKHKPDAVIGFVDVPGHIRFIHNMLAGVAGVDFALLVVAADDGPMPQTLEHLAVLELLGIDRGLVALTKTDRVDKERLAAATAEVQQMLAASMLDGMEIMPVSAQTGDGLEALKQKLSETATKLPARQHQETQNFRLAIDRSFTVSGAGCIVTGSVFSGEVQVGDTLLLSPVGTEVRVRSLHVQNQPAEHGQAGDRCALNIAGHNVKSDDIPRGSWLLDPIAHHPTQRLDVVLRVLGTEPKPLKPRTNVHVHIGASHVTGYAATLNNKPIAPGTSELVQVVVTAPVHAVHGDRLIIRDSAAQRTLGGGMVLDPFSPQRGRARPERWAYLSAMEYPTPLESLQKALAVASRGIDLQHFFTTWNLRQSSAADLLQQTDAVHLNLKHKMLAMGRQRWQNLLDDTLAKLTQWHQDFPTRLGPNAQNLRKTMTVKVDLAVFEYALQHLMEAGQITKRGALLHLPTHKVTLTDNEQLLWQRVQPLLLADGDKPRVVHALAEALEIEPKLLKTFLERAAQIGLLISVKGNRFFLPDSLDRLAKLVEEMGKNSENGMFTVREFKETSDIGRNLSVDVLEYFDSIGLTIRIDNYRKLKV